MLGGLAAFGAVFATVLIFGFLRLNLAPASETVRIVGITTESGKPLLKRVWAMSDPAAVRVEIQSHWDAYFSATVREAQAGAEVIV